MESPDWLIGQLRGRQGVVPITFVDVIEDPKLIQEYRKEFDSLLPLPQEVWVDNSLPPQQEQQVPQQVNGGIDTRGLVLTDCGNLCVYLCVPVCTCVYLCVPVCTCMYLCVPVCTCVYLCAHVCTCVYLCVPVYTCVYLCIPVYMYVCVCTCVYLCTYSTYVHVSTYMCDLFVCV